MSCVVIGLAAATANSQDEAILSTSSQFSVCDEIESDGSRLACLRQDIAKLQNLHSVLDEIQDLQGETSAIFSDE